MRSTCQVLLIIAIVLLATGCPPPSPGSVLRHAAYEGDLSSVRMQLDAGVDADTSAKGSGTALHLAAMRGHTAIVNLLIERGAEIDAALSECESTERWGIENSNTAMRREGRQCIATLSRLKAQRDEARRREQEAARLQAAEAERARQMKDMVKEIVTASSAAATGQAARPAGVRSEVSVPAIAGTARIMGDDDLAVIIGIEGYQNVPKSDYSYDDAKLVKDYAKALGYRERNIELLLDERATKSAVEKTVEAWLRNKAKPGSRVFFYYSGHGAPDPQTGDAYLLPYDGDPNYLATTGYPLARLYANLGKLGAKEVVVCLTPASPARAGGASWRRARGRS